MQSALKFRNPISETCDFTPVTFSMRRKYVNIVNLSTFMNQLYSSQCHLFFPSILVRIRSNLTSQMSNLICSAVRKLGPSVRSPLSSVRPLPSSCSTPYFPRRSSLSSVPQHNQSFRAAFSSPSKPMNSIIPSRTFRLFTFIRYCPLGMPSASIVSAAIMQTSASAAGDALPTVSASNCMNWR